MILKLLTSPDGFRDGVTKCSSNVTDLTYFKIDSNQIDVEEILF